MIEEPPPWDYSAEARERIATARRVVDLGTGGGEAYASLGPFPRVAVATEAWRPNVGVAAARLRPLGAAVVHCEPAPDNDEQPVDGGRDGAGAVGLLPFADGAFDLVLNRHESYVPSEIARILADGGTFLTQQVGREYLADLNAMLDAPVEPAAGFDAAFLADQLRDAGLHVVRAIDAFGTVRFTDVGAIVYYLRMAPWHLPGFDPVRRWSALLRLHERIEASGPLACRGHLCLVEARKPG